MSLGRVPSPLGEGLLQGVILDPIDGVDESAAGGGGAVEVVRAVDAAQERAFGNSARLQREIRALVFSVGAGNQFQK